MKINFNENFSKSLPLVIFFVSLLSFKVDFLNAEYFFKESQIDNSTKTEDDSSAIPTNPFEIVEMIRRYNSLNDATKPTDAVDDALNSFNILGEEKEI